MVRQTAYIPRECGMSQKKRDMERCLCTFRMRGLVNIPRHDTRPCGRLDEQAFPPSQRGSPLRQYTLPRTDSGCIARFEPAWCLPHFAWRDYHRCLIASGLCFPKPALQCAGSDPQIPIGKDAGACSTGSRIIGCSRQRRHTARRGERESSRQDTRHHLQ